MGSSTTPKWESATADEWTTTDQGYPLRSLQDVALVDVAPVLDPAYPDATAGARAMAGALESLAEHVQAPVDEVRSPIRRFARCQQVRIPTRTHEGVR